MKERPILFKGEMVRAILEGRKTQTRRPIKGFLKINLPRDVKSEIPIGPVAYTKAGNHLIHMNPHGAVSVPTPGGILGIKPGEYEWVNPYGQPGDRLWVREAFGIIPKTSHCYDLELYPLCWQTSSPHNNHDAAVYRCGWDRCASWTWKPSIHMPRWASRITLEITNVRVERIQGITPIDTCYGPGSWGRNDWVWVVEFKKVEGVKS